MKTEKSALGHLDDLMNELSMALEPQITYDPDQLKMANEAILRMAIRINHAKDIVEMIKNQLKPPDTHDVDEFIKTKGCKYETGKNLQT